MMTDLSATAKRTLQFMMMNALRTSRRKTHNWHQDHPTDKSPNELKITRSNYFFFRFINQQISFFLSKEIFFCDSSSSTQLRNLFSPLTIVQNNLVKLFCFKVKSFHEFFSISKRSLTYFCFSTAVIAFFDSPNANAHQNNVFFVCLPTQLRMGCCGLMKTNDYVYTMLAFEIYYSVDRYNQKVQLVFIAMERKIVAIFTVLGEGEQEFKKAELGNQEIRFPHLIFDTLESRIGTHGKQLAIESVPNFYWNISVLRLNKVDFRGLMLPQMVLFHVTSGLVEGFVRSMFRPRGRTELAMPREISWHQRSIQDPPILVKNAELSMQIVNAPDMYFMRTTMSKVCYFLSMSMSHAQFQETLDPFQMFMLANYLRDSHETRSLLREKLDLLLIGTPGHLFVRTLLKHLDDCDQAFYHLYYMNLDMFDEYFAYGSIDDWHIKRIDTPTLLNQAKVIIPDTRKEMFGYVQSDDVTW